MSAAGQAGTRRVKSKDGCIGCRLRRKKCSLEKPQCANCLRNGILCTWPEAMNQDHARLLRRTNPRTSAILDDIHARQNVASILDACRLFSPTRLDKSPAYLGIVQENALLRRPTSQRLFDHYLNRTNKAIAVCWGQRNPFLAELIPLALSHQVVLNALLACSGIHMADGALVSVNRTTWIHYGQAIQGQKFGLTQLSQGNVEMVVPLLITAMLLCIVESFKSESQSGFLALCHLKAARALVRIGLLATTDSLQPAPRLAHFLLERYTYTMTLAHISMGTESDEWVLDDTTRLFEMMRAASPGPSPGMYGCVHELFEFIPRVSICARQRHGKLVTDHDEYASLIGAISSWEPRSNDEIYTVCGNVYQHALLVYLYASSPSADTPSSETGCYNPQVQSAFDFFIPLIDSISLESPISTSLCWPLAIFGSCARKHLHRDFIRTRLDALSMRYAAPSVKDTKFLLEKLWILTDDDNDEHRLPANPVGFSKLMKTEGMTVLFF